MAKTYSKMLKEVVLLPREGKTIFEQQGDGVITHMWFGGCFPHYNQTVIKFYFGGEVQPSIEAKMGMMHGIGFETAHTFESDIVGKTGNPCGGYYNNYYIPYQNGVKITVQKDEQNKTEDLFWSIVRASTDIVPIVGNRPISSHARLKLQKLEEYHTRPLEEFVIYESSAKNGALFMTSLAAISANYNFQESCVRAYFQGEMQYLSSGLEDYFLGTYYFNGGKFSNNLAGATYLQPETEFGGYRFHHNDPVFFEKDFRLTVRCGEELDGYIYWDPKPTTYTTYVWAYEWD